MPKWGFNYSKMAKYRFLIDPNTFFDDSGTSKILSKYGPVTLPITVNLLQKIQEKYGNILRKYGFSKSENLTISEKSEVMCSEPQVFLLFYYFLFFNYLSRYLSIYFLRVLTFVLFLIFLILEYDNMMKS